jgi:type IV pilus assembly protein PilA
VNVIAKLRARRDGDESGFTLIELMVVVLIIAILIAIAIPTFLGARSRAQDKAAQSSLRNALTAAKTIYTDKEDYQLATIDSTATHTLKATEPSLSFVAGSPALTTADGPKVVSVETTQDEVILAAISKGGNCFAMKDTVTGAGAGTEFATVTGDCDATTAASASWNPDGW